MDELVTGHDAAHEAHGTNVSYDAGSKFISRVRERSLCSSLQKKRYCSLLCFREQKKGTMRELPDNVHTSVTDTMDARSLNALAQLFP